MRRETSPAAAARVWKQATPQGRRNKGQREREGYAVGPTQCQGQAGPGVQVILAS